MLVRLGFLFFGGEIFKNFQSAIYANLKILGE